jgi:hypothetical protein
MARPNGGTTRQRLWLFKTPWQRGSTVRLLKAPLWRDTSNGAGSSKAVTVWAQAPQRQRRRGPTTVGLDLGLTGQDLGSGVFLKLIFGAD